MVENSNDIKTANSSDAIQGELLPPAEPSEFQVVKSNELIEAQYSLSANEQKLLNACISLVNPLADYGEDGIPAIELTAVQISELTGIARTSIYSFIKRAAYNYAKIPIVKYHAESADENERNFDVVNIAHKSTWKDGVFYLRFHSDIQPDLVDLQLYTRYSLERLKKLDSKYAIRMYELSQRWLKPNTTIPIRKRIPVEEVQLLMGSAHTDPVSGKKETKKAYSEYVNFRRRILEPAIREVNENTDTNIEYVAEKDKLNRTVTNLMFTFKHVSAEAQAAAVVEEIRKLLSDLYEDDVITKIMKKYSDIMIHTNLIYLEKLIEEGLTVRNKGAFFRHLLKYDLASLPEVANPFSRLYQTTTPEYDFVFRHLMVNWFGLPQTVQVDLQKLGLNSKYVLSAYEHFKEAWLLGNKPNHNFHSNKDPLSEEYEEELRVWASADENLDWG